MATSDLFYTETQTISFILVFYSPQYGMTSVLNICADLTGPNPVNMDMSLKHYEIVEGSLLIRFNCLPGSFTCYSSDSLHRYWL